MAKKQPLSLNALLLRAARDGDFDAVRHYAEEGAALETRDDQGRTALHIAAERGYTQSVEILHEMGADMNARDRNGETPLHRAARQPLGKETSALLILLGADITLRNRFGETAFNLVKQENGLKSVLRGAWLAALQKNPLDVAPELDHDIALPPALNIKRRSGPSSSPPPA